MKKLSNSFYVFIIYKFERITTHLYV